MEARYRAAFVETTLIKHYIDSKKIDQSAFNHLKEKMSNKVDECVRTCGHFLGPFIEKRQSRASTKDALSVMEAWILSIVEL